jgi:hypothetical protein
MNNQVPIGTLFKSLPRYGERHHITSSNKTKSNSSPNIESFLESIFNESHNERTNCRRKKLESLSLKNLRKLVGEANDKITSGCEEKCIRWLDLIKDHFFSKTFVKPDKTKRKAPNIKLPFEYDK